MHPDDLQDRPDEGTAAIENLFSYHSPTGDQPHRYETIRAKAKQLAYAIDEHCPPGPDRTHAIRKLREAVMTANAAIATGGGYYPGRS